MKKLLFLLMAVGMIALGVNAQTQKTNRTNSRDHYGKDTATTTQPRPAPDPKKDPKTTNNPNNSGTSSPNGNNSNTPK